MNKKYKRITWWLVVGHLFFFTTLLWNVDDRPRFNSWANNGMSNNHGRVEISHLVYVESLDAIDFITDTRTFATGRDLELEAVIHLLDGSYETIPFEVIREDEHLNHGRAHLRVVLQEHHIDNWWFMELALMDEQLEERRQLRADWRLVRRVEHDLSHIDIYFDIPEEMIPTHPENNALDEDHNGSHSYSRDHEEEAPYNHHHHHGHEQDLSYEALNSQLDQAFINLALATRQMQLDEEDEIAVQRVEFYEAEIVRLGQLLEEYHGD